MLQRTTLKWCISTADDSQADFECCEYCSNLENWEGWIDQDLRVNLANLEERFGWRRIPWTNKQTWFPKTQPEWSWKIGKINLSLSLSHAENGYPNWATTLQVISKNTMEHIQISIELIFQFWTICMYSQWQHMRQGKGPQSPTRCTWIPINTMANKAAELRHHSLQGFYCSFMTFLL